MFFVYKSESYLLWLKSWTWFSTINLSALKIIKNKDLNDFHPEEDPYVSNGLILRFRAEIVYYVTYHYELPENIRVNPKFIRIAQDLSPEMNFLLVLTALGIKLIPDPTCPEYEISLE